MSDGDPENRARERVVVKGVSRAGEEVYCEEIHGAATGG
jgi:hypothetical protein